MPKRRDPYDTAIAPSDVRRMCLEKGFFGTKNQARDNAARNKRNLRPYKCLHCEGWHLTHHSTDLSSTIRKAIRGRASK